MSPERIGGPGGIGAPSAHHELLPCLLLGGNLAGASSVLIMSSILGLTGVSIVTPLMIMLAIVGVATLAVLIKITPEAAVVQHTVDGVRTPIPRMAWLFAVMALAFGLSEGTAVDWSPHSTSPRWPTSTRRRARWDSLPSAL